MDPAGDGEKIRREMRELREEFDSDVQQIVAQARTLTDWRSYVRARPWLCAGAAVAAGYVLTPGLRRAARPDLAELRKLLDEGKQLLAAHAASPPAKATTATSLLTVVLGIAARSLVQRGLMVVADRLSAHAPRPPQPAVSPQPDSPT
ncbi:MAG: hypothetical protein JNM18_13245 [Planctomycetaceae bacterium]|nr:hypothetical protein [Planctomycetaceae bacterium]